MPSILLWALAVAFAILPPSVRSISPAASTLYLDNEKTTFSLNVPNNSSDVYFYFESPAESWVAMGIGDGMTGALMFIMYSSQDHLHITISPRIATDTTEPSYTKDVQLDVLDGSSIQNGMFVLNALCHDCRSWKGGTLNVASTAQPWIYAFGPSNLLASNSLSADLVQHRAYGHFTMNMVQATGVGGVPANTSVMSGTVLVGSETAGSDQVSAIHGYLMAFATLVLGPLTMISTELLHKPRLLTIISIFFTLVALAGLVTGVFDSLVYNRSKDFDSPHQIIGYLVLVILILLAIFGCIQSRRAAEARSRSLLHLYIWIGRVILLLAIINGFLGLTLSDSPSYIIVIYGCCLIPMAVLMAMIYWYLIRKIRKKHTNDSPENCTNDVHTKVVIDSGIPPNSEP